MQENATTKPEPEKPEHKATQISKGYNVLLQLTKPYIKVASKLNLINTTTNDEN